jgi:hypothetical protein
MPKSGGLRLTEDPERQVKFLYRQFSMLMESLARHDVPITLLRYLA